MVGHWVGGSVNCNLDTMIRPICLSFSFVVLWCATNLGQTVEINVVGGKRPVSVYLSRYDFHKAVAVDSAMVATGSTKKLNCGKLAQAAMFTLDVGGQTQELIIGPNDQLMVEVRLKSSPFVIVATGSREQDALNVMLSLSARFSVQMDSLDAALDVLSPFNPRHTAITDSLRQKALAAMSAYNNSLDLIPMMFANTYTARVLVPLDKIPLRSDNTEWEKEFDNDLSYNHIHYFYYVNWNENGLLTNPFLARKIMTWLADYCPHTEADVMLNTKQVLDRCRVNPPLFQALKLMLMEFFGSKEALSLTEFLRNQQL